MEEKKFPRNLVLFSCENESESLCARFVRYFVRFRFRLIEIRSD